MAEVIWSTEILIAAQGLEWGEGPTYLAHEGGYVFTDIPADAIYLYRDGETTPYRSPSHYANGNTTDMQDRLVTCEHQTRRVTRTDHDGRIVVLADQFEGAPLNSPNDVAVTRDGAVWFTDPPYGILRGECGVDARAEQPSGVYRLDPNGTLERVIAIFDKPNGLVFSPDEKVLYVSDTGYSHRDRGNHHIFQFDVLGSRPVNLSIFAEINPGGSDGLRVDRCGNVWSSAGDGIHCFSRDGRLIGKIMLGEMSTNLCFLAEEGRAGLFVTTPTRALICLPDFGEQITGFCADPRRNANRNS